MNGSDVLEAVGEMRRVLGPRTSLDWTVPARDLEWSCWKTAAHVAHDVQAYAGQVVARPETAYLPCDLVVRAGATPVEVLEIVGAAGALLATAVDTADPSSRAWHFGPCDPPGFAAMGVAETLLHTYDIVGGLEVDWTLPSELCAAVLARLFPDAPEGDPGDVLLWSTGRVALEGRPRKTSWVWKAAVS